MARSAGIVAFFTSINAIVVGLRGAVNGMNLTQIFSGLHLFLPVIASGVFEVTLIIIVATIAREQKDKYNVTQAFYIRQRNNG
jgi:hypothetical protein